MIFGRPVILFDGQQLAGSLVEYLLEAEGEVVGAFVEAQTDLVGSAHAVGLECLK